MKRLLIASLSLLAFLAPAAAQTAEEAVAYVFLGLSDGGSLARGKTTMKWTEANPSPAVFEGDGVTNGHPYKIRFTIAALADCDYEITLEGPKEMVPGEKRLFAKVALKDVAGVAITPDGFKTAITGKGFCETGRSNPDCVSIDGGDLFASVSADLHTAAVQHIRTDICPAAKP